MAQLKDLIVAGAQRLIGPTSANNILLPTYNAAYTNSGIQFQSNSSTISSIGGDSNGGLGLYANNLIYLRQQYNEGGAGNGIKISGTGTSQVIAPATTAVMDLGSDTNKFKNLYLSGTINDYTIQDNVLPKGIFSNSASSATGKWYCVAYNKIPTTTSTQYTTLLADVMVETTVLKNTFGAGRIAAAIRYLNTNSTNTFHSYSTFICFADTPTFATQAQFKLLMGDNGYIYLLWYKTDRYEALRLKILHESTEWTFASHLTDAWALCPSLIDIGDGIDVGNTLPTISGLSGGTITDVLDCVEESSYLPLAGGTMTGPIYLPTYSGLTTKPNLQFMNGDTRVGYISGNTGGSLGIYANQNLYLQQEFDQSSGNGIQLTGSDSSQYLRPVTNNQVSLGTSSYKFKDLYLSGNIASGTWNGEIISIEKGGTGVTSTAETKAGKDGDGNTISSTYSKGNGRVFYGTCSTAAATAAKVVNCDYENYTLTTGDILIVKFTNTNSAAVANLTLNVNSTGAKHIKKQYNNSLENLTAVGELRADTITEFIYNGNYWILANADYNTYVTQTATTTNSNYEVLFSGTADNTTRIEGARKNANLLYNPSTGTLAVNKVLQLTNTTNSSISSNYGINFNGSGSNPIGHIGAAVDSDPYLRLYSKGEIGLFPDDTMSGTNWGDENVPALKLKASSILPGQSGTMNLGSIDNQFKGLYTAGPVLINFTNGGYSTADNIDDTNDGPPLRIGHNDNGTCLDLGHDGLQAKTLTTSGTDTLMEPASLYLNYFGGNVNIGHTATATTSNLVNGLYVNNGELIIRKYNNSTTNNSKAKARLGFRLDRLQTDNTILAKATKAFIDVYDSTNGTDPSSNDGSNMVIQSGANMIIGGGESPSACYTELYKNSKDKYLTLVADTNIQFFPGKGGSTPNMGTTNTEMWANYAARAYTIYDETGYWRYYQHTDTNVSSGTRGVYCNFLNTSVNGPDGKPGVNVGLFRNYQNWSSSVQGRTDLSIGNNYQPSTEGSSRGHIYLGAGNSTNAGWIELDATYNSTMGRVLSINNAISASKVWGAVWNDYAEFRITKDTIEPGRCIKEVGDDTLILTTQRLERGCEIVSDTFGFAIGATEEAKTPTATSGRVLAYPYESREEFAAHIGWPVCSGPNGTVSIMTEEEEEKYPSRIIGTISAVPDYEIWHAGSDQPEQDTDTGEITYPGRRDIEVNGRVWIRIR